jgi:hypothetical protein
MVDHNMEKFKDINYKDNNPSMSNMESCKSLLDNLAKHLMKIFYLFWVLIITIQLVPNICKALKIFKIIHIFC